MQCHSLPVGHGKRCDETTFHQMRNVTHWLLVIEKMLWAWLFHKMYHITCFLLVIGQDVIRLHFPKMWMSPTNCLWWKRSWDCLSQNVQGHLLPVGNRKRYSETALQKNLQCHSQTDCHRKGFDQTAFHKMCNITHILLAIGNILIRSFFVPLKQHDMMLTSYVHRKVLHDSSPFHKTWNITHNLVVKRICQQYLTAAWPASLTSF